MTSPGRKTAAYRDHLLLEAQRALADRRITEALAYFDKAEVAQADADACSAGRWMCWMLREEYELAWRESDAIRARGAGDHTRVWDGSAVEGRRVLVRSLHGFGDAVQFLRYAPLLRKRASSVALQVSPRLLGLTRCFRGLDRVHAWEDEPEWDVQIEVTELPLVFRTTVTTLPEAAIPYLSVPCEISSAVRERLGPSSCPRVGMVWTGGAWDSTRSIPFNVLRELFEVAEVEFWSLQFSTENLEWDAFSQAKGWPERKGGGESIEHLAGFLDEMDLVISIDSLAAHLGGALGKTVWLLLKGRADWRWMLERDDSPWYPTLKLFRQSSDGEWGDVISTVRDELAQWAIERRPYGTGSEAG